MRGQSHRVIEQAHQRYGPVFRVSPNELSFASVESWKAIYGPPVGGRSHLIKGEFYDIYGAVFKTGCIGSERDPKVHAQKKKNLTPAFSMKALQAQESISRNVSMTRDLSVVQYEVVLPDSSIVLVNATSHPDLFWALKGGSNYFGIVTRYDMKTIPMGDAFYSGKIWTSASTLPWLDALNAYLAPGGGAEDVKAATMPMIALTPPDGVYEVISLELYADAVNDSPVELGLQALVEVRVAVDMQSEPDGTENSIGISTIIAPRSPR
ncbi:uncharacterized protein BDW70DRAFT_164798 [Aspergillus foveolatus]|uniref:uncharacterized protein n=1 Tax=Aspergillus foveolatus TaxID=210207 RepID=UPI003CCDBE1C